MARIGETLHVNTPPPFFAGLDYTPPMLRRIVWDGQRVAVNSVVVAPDTARPAPTVRASSTVVGSGRPGLEGPARWVTPLSGAAVRQGVGVDDDDIVVGSQLEDAAAGSVDLLDRSTGVVRWSVATGAAIKSTPAIGGHLVVAADVTGAVHAYSREAGHLVWTCPPSVINKGQIEQFGTPDELYRRPETLFVAGFVGTPPMNLFPVDPGSGHSMFGDLRPGTEPDVTIGVRPERFHLATEAPENADAWSLSGRVVLIEPTGRERIVHVQTSLMESFAVIVDADNAPSVGAYVTAWCTRDHVHVYSNRTERRLGNALECGVELDQRVMVV